MNKRFVICSASSTDVYLWADDINKLNLLSNVKEYDGYNLISSNNIEPLTKVYNGMLDDIIKDRLVDYAVFIHADVEIDDLHFFDKIIASEFDLVGVAAATAIDINVTPLSWYNAAKDVRDRRGSITHMIDSKPYLNAYGPPGCPDTARCLCLDGVCMIMNRKAIDSGLRFDERFAFDFYDMDLSFEAVLNHKLSIGVEPIHLIHHSIGEGIMKDSYKIAEKTFKDKWMPVLNQT